MSEYLNIQNVFTVLAVFSTIFYIIKMCLFLFFGGDVEVHSDFDTLSDCDTSFSFFSVQSLLAFFMGFGWVGLAALVQFKTSLIISLAIAFVVGVVFMFVSAWLMFMVKKLDKTIKVDIKDYIGTTGRAYTSFKPHGDGQIEITINNKLSVLNAVNLTEEEIAAFTSIKIEKFEDNTIYITRA